MLLSVAEYADITGRTLSDADRVSVQNILAEVDDAITRRIGPVEAASYTRVLAAPPTRDLELPFGPVSTTGLSVWLNLAAKGDSTAFTSDHLLTRHTDYDLDVTTPDGLCGNRLLRRLVGLWGGRVEHEAGRMSGNLRPTPGAVKVTWTAGYSAVPQALKAAAATAASRLMLMRKTGLTVTSASLNSASFGGQVPQGVGPLDDPAVLELLRPWLGVNVAG